MIIKLEIYYEGQEQPLLITTGDFETFQQAYDKLLLDPSKNIMLTDTESTGHVIRNDFLWARIMEIRDGIIVNDATIRRNAEGIVEPQPSNGEMSNSESIDDVEDEFVEEVVKEKVVEEIKVEEENKENVMAEDVASPEVIEPEVVDESVELPSDGGQVMLPEPIIPSRFKSFREFLQGSIVRCESFVDTFILKMQKREDMLRRANEALDKENEELELLNRKYVTK